MIRSAVVAALLVASPASAGVFLGALDDARPAFIITHPPGFMGDGGELTVRICAQNDSLALVGPLLRVMDTWNALEPMAGNCPACGLIEDPLSAGPTASDAFSTLLHEIGHCALGLDHTNWIDTQGLDTNFTNSRDALSITAGADTVEGSNDDVVLPLPGTGLVHWFRIADNDPVAIDATVIDEDTFSRARLSLPAGHLWAASANVGVADQLGAPGTSAVMFSAGDPDDVFLGLSPDEVATVRFGMTGLDKVAGTADDYTYRLIYVADCAAADFSVQFGTPAGGFGDCVAGTAGIDNPPLITQHFRVVPAFVRMSDAEPWDFGPLIFKDSFEEGDTGAWNDVIE